MNSNIDLFIFSFIIFSNIFTITFSMPNQTDLLLTLKMMIATTIRMKIMMLSGVIISPEKILDIYINNISWLMNFCNCANDPI